MAPKAIPLEDYYVKVFTKDSDSETPPVLHDVFINSEYTIEMLKSKIIEVFALENVEPKHVTIRHNCHKQSNETKVGKKFPLEFQIDSKVPLANCTTSEQFNAHNAASLLELAWERGFKPVKTSSKVALVELLVNKTLEKQQIDTLKALNARIKQLEEENLVQKEIIIMLESKQLEIEATITQEEQPEVKATTTQEEEQLEIEATTTQEEQLEDVASITKEDKLEQQEQIDAPDMKSKNGKKSKK